MLAELAGHCKHQWGQAAQISSSDTPGEVSVPAEVAPQRKAAGLSGCCDEDQLAASGSGGPAVPVTENVLHREAGAGQRPGQFHVGREPQLARGHRLLTRGREEVVNLETYPSPWTPVT